MIPDNILRCMTIQERKALGKRGVTTAEAVATGEAKLEREIHLTISQWLNLHDIPHVHSRTDKRSTQALGIPDFIIFAHKRVLAIECKMPKQKLRPDQEAFKAKLERNGMPLHVVYDAATGIQLIKDFFGL